MDTILEILSEMRNTQKPEPDLQKLNVPTEQLWKYFLKGIGLLLLFLSWYWLSIKMEFHQSSVDDIEAERLNLSSLSTKMEIVYTTILDAEQDFFKDPENKALERMIIQQKQQYVMDFETLRMQIKLVIARNQFAKEDSADYITGELNKYYHKDTSDINKIFKLHELSSTNDVFLFARSYLFAKLTEDKSEDSYADDIWHLNNYAHQHRLSAEKYRKRGKQYYIMGSIILGLIYFEEFLIAIIKRITGYR